MSDHIDAENRSRADRVNSRSFITPNEYLFLYLPFQKEGALVTIFNEIIDRIRDTSELRELVDIFNLIFTTNLETFENYFSKITGESYIYLYDEAKQKAMSDLTEILSLANSELMRDTNLNCFFIELQLIFSENAMSEF